MMKREVQHQRHQVILALVIDHLGHPRETLRLLGIEGGIAAGDDDLISACPGSLADFLARVRCRRRSDRAGIDHNQVSVVNL